MRITKKSREKNENDLLSGLHCRDENRILRGKCLSIAGTRIY